MKVEQLRAEAVRTTRKLEDVVYLSPRELRQVAGQGGEEDGGDVPPEICAIHDYYIDDTIG